MRFPAFRAALFAGSTPEHVKDEPPGAGPRRGRAPSSPLRSVSRIDRPDARTTSRIVLELAYFSCTPPEEIAA